MHITAVSTINRPMATSWLTDTVIATPMSGFSRHKEVRTQYRRVWQGFFRFAAAIGLDGVSLSPGRYWPKESAQDSFERAAEELRWAVEEGTRHGLRVRIEPHIESVTWRPRSWLWPWSRPYPASA